MIVSSQNGDASSTLPIPDPNGLIIGSGKDPRMLMMEEDSTNVVEMTLEVGGSAMRLRVGRGRRRCGEWEREREE